MLAEDFGKSDELKRSHFSLYVMRFWMTGAAPIYFSLL